MGKYFYDKKSHCMKRKFISGRWLALGLFVIVSLVLLAPMIYQDIEFGINCESYLKSASDDPSIELAKIDLDIALKYLEDNGLTNGYSYYFIRDRQSDVGFWYTRLKTARSELDTISDDASGLETSNILMKLRETLLDGEGIVAPPGISSYPYQRWFAFSLILGIIGLTFCGILLLAIIESN
jgi:hypothetical protein